MRGVEAAGVFGPLTVAGEAGRLWLDRFDAGNEHFTGYYGYAAYMLTGETRPFKGGNFDRIRPFKELGNGGLGAFEVALRYDHLDLSNTPVLARAGNEASSVTAGAQLVLQSLRQADVQLGPVLGRQYARSTPSAIKTKGDAFATRLHLDF